MNFPVWATTISPSHSEKLGLGAVNVPVVAAGVLVEPGDVIAADGDGVLVIPRSELARAVEGARRRAAAEMQIRKRIKAGESLYEIANMDAAARAAGIEQIDGIWNQPL
jgi:4-hydroxy-4-methyl-2-oxoglutarate aldolase